MHHRPVLRRGLALVAVVVLLAGCTSGGSDTDSDPGARGERGGRTARPAVAPAWQEADLPAPPGEPGRVAVRDAASCGGRWWVVGGVLLPGTGDDVSRPAAWRQEADGSWTGVTISARTYWGRRAILSSVACHAAEGRTEVALLGAREGGAHGNPRVTTYLQRGDGSFTDVDAPFELYGGPEAVSVGRLAAGPRGWLIAGNRVSGAAVWTSPDARGFTLLDDDPQLSGDDTFGTTALGQVADPAGGWTVVGSATTPGRVPRVPLAWSSPDGRTWAREDVPPTAGFNDLERVVPRGGELVAVGLRDDGFGVWTRAGGYWRTGAGFGRVDPDARAAPSVAGLAVSGSTLLATVSDGSRYALWSSPDARRWQQVETPLRPATAGEHVLGVSTDERGGVLLVGDDGERGRVWLADLPRQ